MVAGGSDGSVAGCTWHMHIVMTSDADRYDAPAVHNAMPRAPYVDVTDAVRNLTITGIKMDDKVESGTETEITLVPGSGLRALRFRPNRSAQG